MSNSALTISINWLIAAGDEVGPTTIAAVTCRESGSKQYPHGDGGGGGDDDGDGSDCLRCGSRRAREGLLETEEGAEGCRCCSGGARRLTPTTCLHSRSEPSTKKGNLRGRPWRLPVEPAADHFATCEPLTAALSPLDVGSGAPDRPGEGRKFGKLDMASWPSIVLLDRVVIMNRALKSITSSVTQSIWSAPNRINSLVAGLSTDLSDSLPLA